MELPLTSADIAARVGCTPDTATRVARANEIGRRIGRLWVFTPEQADRLASLIRPSAGNPNFVPGNRYGKPPKNRRKRVSK